MKTLVEFLVYLVKRKRLWLIPISIVIFLAALLVLIGQNPVIAPFIYTLF